jgi:hypothetical protein
VVRYYAEMSGPNTQEEPDIAGSDVIRHALAAVKYRADKAIEGAPTGFGVFSAGEGTRSPCELLRHITAVIGQTTAALTDGHFHEEQGGPLSLERDRADAAIRTLANSLVGRPLTPETTKRLLQGPVADAISHVGQLALLRRLIGSPIAGENFYAAAIDADDLQ